MWFSYQGVIQLSLTKVLFQGDAKEASTDCQAVGSGEAAAMEQWALLHCGKFCEEYYNYIHPGKLVSGMRYCWHWYDPTPCVTKVVQSQAHFQWMIDCQVFNFSLFMMVTKDMLWLQVFNRLLGQGSLLCSWPKVVTFGFKLILFHRVAGTSFPKGVCSKDAAFFQVVQEAD